MSMKFIMIGCGWRAQYFLRAAEILSDRLEVSAIVMHSEKRAQEIQQETGILTTTDLETALDTKPEFALLCVPRSVMKEWILRLCKLQIPVLCETPPGQDIEELNNLWKEVQILHGKVQVTEQYFLQPYYAAVQNVIDSGILGEISNVSMSSIHGYHAISIFRKFLGIGMENCKISGKTYQFPVTKTRDRAGWHTSGEILIGNRARIDIIFENGKAAFYDFDDEQYFSPIRSRSWVIQGARGEVRGDQICYMDHQNRPVSEQMRREDDGVYNIDGWSHRYISFRGERIYENPFPGARINDDEIAVTDLLAHMKQYVETGKEFYPLREGLQDAYLSFLMDEAVKNPGKEIISTSQSWSV